MKQPEVCLPSGLGASPLHGNPSPLPQYFTDSQCCAPGWIEMMGSKVSCLGKQFDGETMSRTPDLKKPYDLTTRQMH